MNELPVALTYTVIIAMTIAITNRIKAEAPALKSFWYTLISIAAGAILYAVSLYAPVVVQGFIFIGLAAAGIFDVYSKNGILKTPDNEKVFVQPK